MIGLTPAPLLTGGQRVTRVDRSIDIKAPKETIFEYVADIGNEGDWVKWAKDVRVTSLERAKIGATDAMLMQVGPSKKRVEGIITELVPNYTVARRLTTGMDFTERLSVVPVLDGTKLAWNVEYEPPGGGIGKLMDVLFMSTLLDQLMGDSLDILKDKIEG
jgi:uncharacterized membrane protein